MSRLLSIVLLIAIFTACTPSNQPHTASSQKEFALVIHGGAGVISRDMSDEMRDRYLASLEAAVRAGEEMLREGRSALDVVEAVVIILEDDPLFNAGVGAVYTSEALHELDAAIMDGRDLNAGAVAGLRTVRNPISMARYIMEQTPHVFFAGAGAEQLADQTDLVRVDNSHFNTENRRNQLDRAMQRAAAEGAQSDIAYTDNPQSSYPRVIFIEDADRFGTVGAVALDRDGNLAAATSTGGMTNKMPGRVGDVPVIGAGTYADNRTAAISATGHGEKFIRNVVAYQIAAGMEYEGLSLAAAADRVINGKLDQGDGGIIAVDRFGNISMTFNSLGMYRGAVDSDGFFEVAIWE
ncbi:MAG: isoaspartyl peptidase/L-asparaginase [Bacteroidetes bacterium]|nr:isoaspartyl peptidase/L-asparaginase [Bacteroidota bacterium]MCH8523143.1 isoaspartyl peptidase/L-asparaginase [Balneolales bacterium]